VFNTVALGTARADETVWVAPVAFTYHGVAAEYERDLPERPISLAVGLALRSTADGDYDSTTVGVAGEARYWIRRHWYAAGRLDLAHTSVTDEMDETIGRQHTIGVAALTGYRFAPWRGLELRPYAGLAVRRDSDHDGRLAAWTRPGLAYGLALGWSW
jgi:hypothetical protein